LRDEPPGALVRSGDVPAGDSAPQPNREYPADGSIAADGAGSASTTERVELSMPVVVQLFPVVRMMVGVVASRLEFDYEDICDLRLAIDELLTLCTAGHAEGSKMTVVCSSNPGKLRVDCSVSPVATRRRTAGTETGEQTVDARRGGLDLAELSGRILDALVDGHGTRQDEGSTTRVGWLWKNRPPD
jgi:hypothetical protein